MHFLEVLTQTLLNSSVGGWSVPAVLSNLALCFPLHRAWVTSLWQTPRTTLWWDRQWLQRWWALMRRSSVCSSIWRCLSAAQEILLQRALPSWINISRSWKKSGTCWKEVKDCKCSAKGYQVKKKRGSRGTRRQKHLSERKFSSSKDFTSQSSLLEKGCVCSACHWQEAFCKYSWSKPKKLLFSLKSAKPLALILGQVLVIIQTQYSHEDDFVQIDLPTCITGPPAGVFSHAVFLVLLSNSDFVFLSFFLYPVLLNVCFL